MNTNDSDRECLFPSLVVCTENIVNRRWLFFSIFLWEIIHSNMGHGDRICYAMHPARFRQTRTNYLHTQKKEDPPARVARDHLYMHPRRDIKWAGGDVLPLNRRLAWTAWTTNNLKCKQRDSDRSHGVMPTHIHCSAGAFWYLYVRASPFLEFLVVAGSVSGFVFVLFMRSFVDDCAVIKQTTAETDRSMHYNKSYGVINAIGDERCRWGRLRMTQCPSSPSTTSRIIYECRGGFVFMLIFLVYTILVLPAVTMIRWVNIFQQ